MADLDDVRRLVAGEHGLATVSLGRDDGSVHSSVVNAGVMDHPVSGTPVVALVARGASWKVRRLRTTPLLTVVFRVSWDWVGVSGTTELVGPDDELTGFDPAGVPQLLRDVFVAAGGTHDDWPTYDQVMADERRTAVLVTPTRFLGN